MPTLTVPDKVIGKGFSRVNIGERIYFYYQYFNIIEKKWKISYFWKSFINDDKVNYKKPTNIIGYIKTICPLIKKTWKKLFIKEIPLSKYR